MRDVLHRLQRLQPVTDGQRRVAQALAVIAALAVIGVSEAAYHSAQESWVRVRGQQVVRFEMSSLLRHLNAAESSQRGFLIIGRDEYLRPMMERRALIEQLMGSMRRHYQGSAWTEEVDRLERSIQEKFGELDETVRLYRLGSHEAWHALMDTDIGREKMEQVRAATDRLIAYESERILESRRTINRSMAFWRYRVMAMSLLTLLGLLVYLRQSATVLNAERRHAADLKGERDQLDLEVARRTEQLVELTRHLHTVREDERARLARELHDELGALLTAAKLDLARLRRAMKTELPARAELGERLLHLGRVIDDGIQLKRRIIEDLRPSALSNLGLRAALEILAREFGERSGLRMQLELAVIDEPDGERALAIYRATQEALTNIAKYAQAQRVRIELHALPSGGIWLQVEDDGRGFEPAAVPHGRHGLLGMRYRAEALGGRLQLHSAPGQGTRVRLELPSSYKPA